MSSVDNYTQHSSSSSKSNKHIERLVNLSEDEQLQHAIKMSEKEEMFRVAIYSCKKLNPFQSKCNIITIVSLTIICFLTAERHVENDGTLW